MLFLRPTVGLALFSLQKWQTFAGAASGAAAASALMFMIVYLLVFLFLLLLLFPAPTNLCPNHARGRPMTCPLAEPQRAR